MLLALILAASPASLLNDEGMRQYRAKNWESALTHFRGAIAADPEYALGHYNLAATLSRLRGLGKTCQYEAYQRVVLDELEAAIRADERRQARALVDRDFDSVRGTFRFQRLSDHRLEEPDVRYFLTAIAWFTRGEGAFGSTRSLRFAKNGTFTLVRLVMKNDVPKRETVRGRWKMNEDDDVTMTFDVPVDGRRSTKAIWVGDGTLVVEDLGAFGDEPSECDA